VEWELVQAVATRAVRSAGLRAAAIRSAAQLQVEQKGSGVFDPVTVADRASEQLMTETIRSAFPDDLIVGEETGGGVPATGRCWVLDGVDGTVNFLSGSSDWCAALCLVEDGEPLVAACFCPGRDELTVAASGLGCFRNGTRVSVRPLPYEEGIWSTYISPAKLDRRGCAELLSEVAHTAAGLRMHGSGTLELARVATGELQGWYQSQVPPWDWLPGRLFVEEAGGVTRTVGPEPPFRIAACDPENAGRVASFAAKLDSRL
jgi:fructose-1,6-bisphosphatase/inositol monophosphatase family enzyme